MAKKINRNILLYSDTARSADALYFGGVEVPDPFVALSVRGRKFAVVSALEFGRVKRASDFDAVLSLESCLEKARRAWPGRRPGPALVVALLARDLKAGAFTVPDDFPAGLYRELRELGLRIEIASVSYTHLKGYFPMRVVSNNAKGTFRLDVTAVQKESEPDSEFAPPAGWRKFDIGSMMGGAFPGGMPGAKPAGNN